MTDAGCPSLQKNPRAHKNKIGTSPPPQKTPPQNAEFYGHGFSCRKNAFFPGVHKIGAAISGPRIADTNFTDTRIFLISVRANDEWQELAAMNRALERIPAEADDLQERDRQ